MYQHPRLKYQINIKEHVKIFGTMKICKNLNYKNGMIITIQLKITSDVIFQNY